MNEWMKKSHKVSIVRSHITTPAKYKRVVLIQKPEQIIKEACIEISNRYEIEFMEIGQDQDNVNLPIQSLHKKSSTKKI